MVPMIQRLYAWWKKKPTRDTLVESLQNARTFEEWEITAYKLDEALGNDLWRQNASSKYYDYRLIYQRLQAIIAAREDEDILGLVSLLRSGLVRNLGNITAARLFNRAYAGTKLLIEQYVTQIALAIQSVVACPTAQANEFGLTNQAKLDLFHDTRQAFGRSALVLQGGAVFELCHVGVVKALYLQGVLPRIICGSGTGALIAALVGVHGENDLLELVDGRKSDLVPFVRRKLAHNPEPGTYTSWLAVLIQRAQMFLKKGSLSDTQAQKDHIRTIIGDVTFEEAYQRTKRVLNIMVATEISENVPSLLNYLTAPNVLIWSAASASNKTTPSSPAAYAPITLLCKDSITGSIYPWSSTVGSPSPSSAADTSAFNINHMPQIHATPADPRDTALSRVAELFNVNHFIHSVARPSVFPLLRLGDVLTQTHHSPGHYPTRLRSRLWYGLIHLCTLEIHHRLRQIDTLGFLPGRIRNFLIDEVIPGSSITLVPDITLKDFARYIFSQSSEEREKSNINEWILRGERSVWPNVSALRVRCLPEIELERGYQFVRRRKPMDVRGRSRSGSDGKVRSGEEGHRRDEGRLRGAGEKRRRKRARTSSGGGSGSANPGLWTYERGLEAKQ